MTGDDFVKRAFMLGRQMFTGDKNLVDSQAVLASTDAIIDAAIHVGNRDHLLPRSGKVINRADRGIA